MCEKKIPEGQNLESEVVGRISSELVIFGREWECCFLQVKPVVKGDTCQQQIKSGVPDSSI